MTDCVERPFIHDGATDVEFPGAPWHLYDLSQGAPIYVLRELWFIFLSLVRLPPAMGTRLGIRKPNS